MILCLSSPCDSTNPSLDRLSVTSSDTNRIGAADGLERLSLDLIILVCLPVGRLLAAFWTWLVIVRTIENFVLYATLLLDVSYATRSLGEFAFGVQVVGSRRCCAGTAGPVESHISTHGAFRRKGFWRLVMSFGGLRKRMQGGSQTSVLLRILCLLSLPPEAQYLSDIRLLQKYGLYPSKPFCSPLQMSSQRTQQTAFIVLSLSPSQ